MINENRLKELLIYDIDTGIFTWKVSRGTRKAGSVAGSLNGEGYLNISIDGIKHQSHRLVFLYVNGIFPEKQIDHVNGVKTDNKWTNLREATQNQNQKNRAITSNNSTGFKGVGFHKASNKYRARASLNGVIHNLGLFDTALKAFEAYQCFAKSNHHEFYCGDSKLVRTWIR